MVLSLLWWKNLREVTLEDYTLFLKEHNHVVIEDVKLPIGGEYKIKSYQPSDFQLETTTVWSFPDRGKWATHYLNAKYRGNWSPYIPRNLILRYTKEYETVLDPFMGSGTTIIEAKILYRNAIGVDINLNAVILAHDRLRFDYKPLEKQDEPEPVIKLYQGDARNLDLIDDESIDLIATHPPYVNIIGYSKNTVKGDLSRVRSVDDFVKEMKKVAREFYRVLKPGRYCAILMGDTRRNKHHVPVSFRVMQAFLEQGFILKENIIKIQHNMKTTPLWRKRSQELNFLLLKHEHLFVFRKPEPDEKINKYKESAKWW